MRLLLIAFLISLASADSFLDKFPQEENVLVLTNDNFDEALKLNNLLVEFYAPWCGHCKALAPELALAATHLRKEGKEVYIAKVDATQDVDLSLRFSISSYPTLKFFKDGVPAYEYTGGRTSTDLIKWVLRKTEPQTLTLDSLSKVKEFIDSAPVTIVGFFLNLDSDEAKAYNETASLFDEYSFGIVNDKEIFSAHGISKDAAVVLFKNFDEKQNHLVENINKDELRKFIFLNSLPSVIEFNRLTSQKIFTSDFKNHNLLFLSKSNPESENLVQTFRNVALQFKGKVLFVTVDSDIDDHESILNFFAVQKSTVPEIRLIQIGEEMVKFKPLNNDLSEQAIKNFVDDVLSGKIKPHLLSQELPKDWDKNPVKILVASNFEKVALDKSKDVLVEFYAPWCGHCKKLEPIYNELGEMFANDENVVIAKMDATANELENVKINEFPTIRLFKKNNNQVSQYDGERNLDGLIRFIKTGGEYGKAVIDSEEDEEEEKPDVGAKDEL